VFSLFSTLHPVVTRERLAGAAERAVPTLTLRVVVVAVGVVTKERLFTEDMGGRTCSVAAGVDMTRVVNRGVEGRSERLCVTVWLAVRGNPVTSLDKLLGFTTGNGGFLTEPVVFLAIIGICCRSSCFSGATAFSSLRPQSFINS